MTELPAVALGAETAPFVGAAAPLHVTVVPLELEAELVLAPPVPVVEALELLVLAPPVPVVEPLELLVLAPPVPVVEPLELLVLAPPVPVVEALELLGAWLPVLVEPPEPADCIVLPLPPQPATSTSPHAPATKKSEETRSESTRKRIPTSVERSSV